MKKAAAVGVVGLTGQSVFLHTAHLPRPGETVTCPGLWTEAGGKGHNQAVAATRLGAQCTFVGAVGRDAWGEMCRAALEKDGVQALLVAKDTPTAFACVTTEDSGENTVGVYTGAAACLAPKDLFATPIQQALAACDVLLMQRELPDACLLAVLSLAGAQGIPVLLNPAPARALPRDILRRVWAVTPNEEEAKMLAGLAPDAPCTPTQLAQALRAAGVLRAAVTLGAKGVLLVEETGETQISALAIHTVVDTTGAGDTFNGALAARLAHKDSFAQAARFAAVAASLSVTQKGAINGIPQEEQVNAALVKASAAQ